MLEVHARGSQVDDRERANRLVFDLDPGPGTDFKDVIDTAREVRERLRRVKLKSFVKTTGGKGLHVVVPIRPTPWAVAKNFAHTVAASMAKDEPARYTANPIKARRHHRVFIDYLRNSREATAIVPYSTRARAGAPVAVPCPGGELCSLKAANQYTVKNISQRLSKLRRGPVGGHGAQPPGAAEAQIRSHGTVDPACALVRAVPSAFGGALFIGKPPNTSIAPTRMQRQASPRGFPAWPRPPRYGPDIRQRSCWRSRLSRSGSRPGRFSTTATHGSWSSIPGTTIVTFLMVFLIQNTQNRDTLAIQLKLSELVLAMKGAQNKFAAIEDLSDEELARLHEECRARAEMTRTRILSVAVTNPNACHPAAPRRPAANRKATARLKFRKPEPLFRLAVVQSESNRRI